MTRPDVHEVIAGLWCQLLDVPTVSDDDDFFGLGGDSLTAITMVDSIERELGIVFPLEILFQVGTFGAIVEACRDGSGSPAERDAVT